MLTEWYGGQSGHRLIRDREFSKEIPEAFPGVCDVQWE